MFVEKGVTEAFYNDQQWRSYFTAVMPELRDAEEKEEDALMPTPQVYICFVLSSLNFSLAPRPSPTKGHVRKCLAFSI
jgi:hypothetical protein